MSWLGRLNLSGNQLSGSIPESIGQLPWLTYLNLGVNSLDGVIQEAHFSNLSFLMDLDLSSNSLLVFNVSSTWIPPFDKLYSLNLSFTKVGRDFPKWLGTQSSCTSVDISHAGISDVFPSWLWEFLGHIYFIDVSHNQISGKLLESKSDVSLSRGLEVRFSSNQLEGPIPSAFSDVAYVDLSNNTLNDMTSFLCDGLNEKKLKYLNLSGNHISGEIPDCWRHFVNLNLLDLSVNSFSGRIPPTLGYLFQMESLKLRSNGLVGELPSSLENCATLKVLDLGHNELFGSVPEWLGIRMPNLVILMLGSNHFSGSLPSQICHLTHLQILDFSMNELSGTIPYCLSNLTSLVQGNSSQTIRNSINRTYADGPTAADVTPTSDFDDDATFMWKGTMHSFRSNLGLVKKIDLSRNRFSGKIPVEITRLLGLVSLDLSRNRLTGEIPQEIGQLQSLDSLDLSTNMLDGEIPISLARIDRLAYLDVSNNNLSGAIPTGTQLQRFDPSFYAGNSLLCGVPLANLCDPERKGQSPPVPRDNEERDELVMQGFYISMGLGFAVGFWVVCGSLIFKRSWRYAYYKFLNVSNDWLYLRMALIIRKLREMLTR